uniref:Uncharacterized protein n=1 Tax=Arundo donax TaxID=35708 RepID=A0A0A9GMT4_ARUDO
MYGTYYRQPNHVSEVNLTCLRECKLLGVQHSFTE